MTPKSALDAIVSGLAEIEAGFSEDDSASANPWEEIKDQLQNEPSGYWPMYLETMRQFVAGLVSGLEGDDLAELQAALKCSSHKALEQKLIQRLLARGRKEKIRYAPFDFEYFCYRLLNFTVYGHVVERTGLCECYAHVFSPDFRYSCGTVSPGPGAAP